MARFFSSDLFHHLTRTKSVSRHGASVIDLEAWKSSELMRLIAANFLDACEHKAVARLVRMGHSAPRC